MTNPFPPFGAYVAAATIAFSAITYELLLASYASVLLGSAINEFALVIGTMMAAMGVGAYASERFRTQALVALITVNLIVAVLSFIVLPSLYLSFRADSLPTMVLIFYAVLFGLSFGMEIPLLSRFAGSEVHFSRLLFLDYLGGFLGGIAFPLWLLPNLGFFATSSLLGIMNAALACYFAWSGRRLLARSFAAWLTFCLLALAASLMAYVFSDAVRLRLENHALFGTTDSP